MISSTSLSIVWMLLGLFTLRLWREANGLRLRVAGSTGKRKGERVSTHVAPAAGGGRRARRHRRGSYGKMAATGEN